MKKAIYTLILLLSLTATADGQTARQVLDKAAAVVSSKQGVSAEFTMTGAQQTHGTIQVKGRRFHAVTPHATVWFDGKTMWTYMKKSDEVNVSHPSDKQLQALNPYNFINMYKKGYELTLNRDKGVYKVHLTALDATRSIREMYITVSAANYHPAEVRMRQQKGWTTFTISNLKAEKIADAAFAFNAADYPTAELIDLR